MGKGGSIIKKIIRKFFLALFVIFIIASVSLPVLAVLSEWYYPEAWGSYNLGDGFYMIEFDGGRIIVYGTKVSGHTCYGGAYLIPSFEKSYTQDFQHRKIIVQEAISDEEWIIAVLYDLEEDKNLYAVYNKKSTAESPSELTQFVLYFNEFQDVEDYCTNNKINRSLLSRILISDNDLNSMKLN